jgi:nicotinate-nucleotide pyrophosphorylase (carboxylating)
MDVSVADSVTDGSMVKKNQVVMNVEGSSGNILMAERTALNILGRMSGIATVTKGMVEKARRVNPSIRIAATRKTTPGFRIFEKMAAVIGGADSHRFFTGDAVLIKNNHLLLIGSVKKALQLAKSTSFIRKIEIEVRSLNEAIEAAEECVDVIMFDNMSPDMIRAVMDRIEELGLGKNILFEASGGIKPENVEEYARTGVDIISSGYITHSARMLNVSLYLV